MRAWKHSMEAERPKRRALEQRIFKRLDEVLEMEDNESLGVGLDTSLEKSVHHGVPWATQMTKDARVHATRKEVGDFYGVEIEKLWGYSSAASREGQLPKTWKLRLGNYFLPSRAPEAAVCNL